MVILPFSSYLLHLWTCPLTSCRDVWTSTKLR
jgi:hypothetical protein